MEYVRLNPQKLREQVLWFLLSDNAGWLSSCLLSLTIHRLCGPAGLFSPADGICCHICICPSIKDINFLNALISLMPSLYAVIKVSLSHSADFQGPGK